MHAFTLCILYKFTTSHSHPPLYVHNPVSPGGPSIHYSYTMQTSNIQCVINSAGDAQKYTRTQVYNIISGYWLRMIPIRVGPRTRYRASVVFRPCTHHQCSTCRTISLGVCAGSTLKSHTSVHTDARAWSRRFVSRVCARSACVVFVCAIF